MRVAATGHSDTLVCLTDGVLLQLSDLAGVLNADPQRGRVTAFAGTTVSAFGDPLWDAGLALANQGDIDTQQIGGAIGTGTHGSGVRLGSFSSTLRSARIVTGGPKMLAIAAKFGDGWSSWGGYGVETEAEFYKVTAERCERFDELVAKQGRDPKTIRHSLVCFPPLTPWESPGYFADMVGRFMAVGIDEFVLYWPGSWRPDARHERHIFEQVASEVIPTLRAEQNPDVIASER